LQEDIKTHYQIPDIQIINKDCIEGMNQLKDNSIDLAVTSPPYNIGIDYNEYEDQKEWSEYEIFIKKVFRNIYRILKDKSIFACNVGNQRNSGLPHYIYFWLKECGFKIIKEIFWYKGLYYIQGETIFVCSKTGEYNKYYTKNDGFYSNGQFSTVWEMRYKNNESRKKLGHNAFFVEQIPKNFIEITTKINDVILDPFSGTGTVALSCKKLNRRFIGFEIDEKYYKQSLERLNNIPKRLDKWF